MGFIADRQNPAQFMRSRIGDGGSQHLVLADPLSKTAEILGAGGADYVTFDATDYSRIWAGPSPAVINSPIYFAHARTKRRSRPISESIAAQPELIVNGRFVDATSWLFAGGGGGGSWAAVDGEAIISGASSAFPQIRQTYITVPGKRYVLSAIARNIDSNAAAQITAFSAAEIAHPVLGVDSGNFSSVKRRITTYFTAETDTVRVVLFANQASVVGSVGFSDISLKELPEELATISTYGATSERPTLTADGIKFDGADDRLVTRWLANPGANPNSLIVQLAIPASIAADQTYAGVKEATQGRMFLSINPFGRFQGGVGEQSTGVIFQPSKDWRGAKDVFAISATGSEIRLFSADGLVYQGPQVGFLAGSRPFQLGCLDNAGTLQAFVSGAIKRVAFSKSALDLIAFQAIRSEWLANP